MRVFLDTNVLASALVARGLCADLLQHVVKEQTLVVGTPVVTELQRVLPRKLGLPREIVDGYVAFLLSVGEPAHDMRTPGEPIPDPDDVPVISSALAANVDVFVTGDRALLELGKVDGMPIVSPRGLWETLRDSTASADQET